MRYTREAMKRLMLSIVLAACGGGSASPSHETAKPTPTTASDPSCPLEVPGTSVSVEDTATGAALVFVTTSDAAAVRTRAQAFAEMHAKHDGPRAAMGMMFPAEWTASAKEIEGGARVEFAAGKPEGAGDVQSQLRMHAGHLTSGTCAM
jgi:hypothetical protein